VCIAVEGVVYLSKELLNLGLRFILGIKNFSFIAAKETLEGRGPSTKSKDRA